MSRGLIGSAIAMLLLALPVVALLQGWIGTERMPVRWLEIRGEFHRVSADQLRSNISQHAEGGFFSVSLEAVRRAAQAQPWVAQVQARKVWPDTLELTVLEHQPLAHWNRQWLLTRAGTLIDLPGPNLIAGLPRLNGPEDQREEVIEFHDAARELLAGSGLVLNQIDLSGLGSWTLTLDDGSTIIAGREQPYRRLQRFVRVYPRLAPMSGARFARADLRYGNGFAMSWRVAPVEPLFDLESSEAET